MEGLALVVGVAVMAQGQLAQIFLEGLKECHLLFLSFAAFGLVRIKLDYCSVIPVLFDLGSKAVFKTVLLFLSYILFD